MAHKLMVIFGLISITFFQVSCEEQPSEDWKEKDGKPEQQLQIMCDGFKESDNWDCDCFKKVTKEMFPDLKEFYKVRSDETKYAKENDAWYAKLDEKCKTKTDTIKK